MEVFLAHLRPKDPMSKFESHSYFETCTTCKITKASIDKFDYARKVAHPCRALAQGKWHSRESVATGSNRKSVAILSSKRALKYQRSERRTVTQERFNGLHGQLDTTTEVDIRCAVRRWRRNSAGTFFHLTRRTLVQDLTPTGGDEVMEETGKFPVPKSSSSSARTSSTCLSVPTRDQVRSLLGDAQRDPREATREKLNASIAVLPSVTQQSDVPASRM